MMIPPAPDAQRIGHRSTCPSGRRARRTIDSAIPE
jgi:hypothetical protein